MTLLRLLTWIRMYHRKEFLDHRQMIIIVYGYTINRKSSMENTDWSEWVTTSLCDNTRRSYLKESVPDRSNLIIIWYIIVVLWFYTHNMFTAVSYNVNGYKFSLMMISKKIRTKKKWLHVRHWVTVMFLTPFVCPECWGHIVCQVYSAAYVR